MLDLNQSTGSAAQTRAEVMRCLMEARWRECKAYCPPAYKPSFNNYPQRGLFDGTAPDAASKLAGLIGSLFMSYGVVGDVDAYEAALDFVIYGTAALMPCNGYFVRQPLEGIVLIGEDDRGRPVATDGRLIAFRCRKTPGELYGCSLVMEALPDIKTANKVVELVFKNASTKLSMPPPRAAKTFDTSSFVLDELRSSIKRILLADKVEEARKLPRPAREAATRSLLPGWMYARLQRELFDRLETVNA